MSNSKILIFGFTFLFTCSASATWSIAVLNKETQTIAVAGASCSYMVYGIASVVPGKGVAVVQAASNGKARAEAIKLISEDKPLIEIMEELTTNADYEPQNQQYALLSFNEYDTPLVYTGEKVEASKGTFAAKGMTVQVNTMVSEKVLAKSMSILSKSEWSDDIALAKAVMASLNAGANEGGDKRCKGSNSSTAFVSLYKKDNNKQVPWLNLVIYGIEAGKKSAISVLNEQFDQWLKNAQKNPSTQVYMIPHTN